MTDHTPAGRRVLVTDFDGTLTRRDFYRLVVERLLPADTPDYWAEYQAGRLTHFEALNAFFAASRPDAASLVAITGDMGLGPGLRSDVEALARRGWDVVVASAGCSWYIDRLLAEAGVRLTVHANPGAVESGRLVMRLPTKSPFFSGETGVEKVAIVRHALETAEDVAFAGDGPPDLEPALLVSAENRFATGHLADELDRRGEPFYRFSEWSEVAATLTGRTGP